MKKIFFVFLCLNYSYLFAQTHDIRSGDISFKHIGGNSSLEYELDLTIYTSQPRTDSVVINWFGGVDTLPFPAPAIVGGNIYQYSFTPHHVYPGPGFYYIYTHLYYPVESISNLHDSTYFLLSAFLWITPNITPPDNSPICLTPQDFHKTCCNQIIYNPNAYDPDGDSLSYALYPYDSTIYSLMGAQIDPINGDLTFTPPHAGKYFFSIVIAELRGSDFIGSITRNILWDVDSATAVEEINANHAMISIYPNPLTSSSTLQLNTQLKDAEVTITDMLGKEMLRKKLTGDRMEIEKGSLESGVYFVRVRSEERQSAGGRIRCGEWVEKVVVE